VASDERSDQELAFPLVTTEVVNDSAARQAAQQGILIAAIVAVFGIFLLLQAAFRSWRLALVGIVTLPAALAGGMMANFLGNGGTLSLGLLAGSLTVMGIALRNLVMLFSHYQHLEEHGGEDFGPELIVRGARERLSPTLMTALATGLALLSFVLFGKSLHRSCPIITIGGVGHVNLVEPVRDGVIPALAPAAADLGFQRLIPR
jgi:multidrug efflux pump subunit AcrB